MEGIPIELIRLGETYNRMAERIEMLIREMQEINDNIAHDLRSPVTKIRGLAEMAVASAEITKDNIEVFGGIVEECDRQINMINTMLEISEVEAGIGEMTVGSIGVEDLILKTRELFLPLAEESNVRLEIGNLKSFTIEGDLRKIQRALANIVENALKYTPAGGRVCMSAELNRNIGKIIINDTGIGIPPDVLPKVFDRFYRGDASRNFPGNGLGLSLAMAFAHAHHGTIKIESKLNKGTTCSLHLPCSDTFIESKSDLQ